MKSEKGPFWVRADTERFTYSIPGLTQTMHDRWDIWGKQAKTLTDANQVKVQIPTVNFYVQSGTKYSSSCCVSSRVLGVHRVQKSAHPIRDLEVILAAENV
jgi:hypothetical protein